MSETLFRPIVAVLLATLIAGASACRPEITDQTPVEIRLSPEHPSVPMGLPLRLEALGVLQDESTREVNKEVTWVSLNPAVADVDAEGTVTGNLAGTATIRVDSEDWGLFAEVNVTVTASILRPVAEYETAGTLIFSGEFYFGSEHVKDALLRERPLDVDTIVYTAYSSDPSISEITSWGEGAAPGIPFQAVGMPGRGVPFWTRDALPIPVWVGTEEAKSLAVVDADYYHEYEPDAQIARALGASHIKLGYEYEGGNFLTDTKGNCFTIHAGTSPYIPESAYKAKLGCRTLTRFPYRGGIGHVDERVKLLSDTVAVTDTPSYVSTLTDKGFTVKLLPAPSSPDDMRTYVNALLVNGVLFLPVYGDAMRDAAAIEIYENQGLRVVPLDSNELSNDGMGSIHCITATYPAGAVFDATKLDPFTTSSGNGSQALQIAPKPKAKGVFPPKLPVE